MPTRCRLSLHGNCCGPNGASLGGQKRPPGPSQVLSSNCPSCQRAWSTTRWFAQSPCWCHTRAGTEPLLQPQTQTLLRCVRCPVPSQFVQYRPTAPVLNGDFPTQAAGHEATSTGTVSYPSSALFPSAMKGLTGPQIASALQVRFDLGGKRCARTAP